MKKLLLILVLIDVSTARILAQDEKDVFYRNLFFKDLYTSGNYDEAYGELVWILENDPQPDENVYIRGIKVVNALIDKAPGDSLKSIWQQEVMALYEQRLDRFGYSAKVKNLQLTQAYKYWANHPNKSTDLLLIFKKNLEESSEDISNANLLAYMDAIKRADRFGVGFSPDEVIDEYDVISSTLESRLVVSDDPVVFRNKVDEIFLNMGGLDCNSFKERFGDSVRDDLEAVNRSKLYLKLAFKLNCEKDETFHRALDYVLKYEPSLDLLLYKSKFSMAQRELDEAESTLGKALTYEMTSEIESDIYYDLARVYALKEEKSKSRDFALKSIEKHQNSKSRALIGSLYMSSFSDCADDKDIVERRAIYIAAYNQFKLANDTENMSLAKANFPSMDEIFYNGYELGQSVTVACWFDETVILDKRNN